MNRKIPPHEIVQDMHLMLRYVLDFKNVIKQPCETEGASSNKQSRLRDIFSQMNKLRIKYDQEPMDFEIDNPRINKTIGLTSEEVDDCVYKINMDELK